MVALRTDFEKKNTKLNKKINKKETVKMNQVSQGVREGEQGPHGG